LMDGMRAAREILTSTPNVPILMNTLHKSPELILEAKKLGVRDVVGKADAGDALLAAIESLLGTDPASSDDKAAVPPTEASRATAANGTASMSPGEDHKPPKSN
jgi:DNA-binding NarL/FixJ family response regulator